MKKLITVLASVVLSVVLFTGCATTPSNTAVTQAAITTAAALGTAYDLSSRPGDLAYFVAAEQELYTISNGTNALSASTVNALMVADGQTNAFVNVAIVSAVTLANAYISANTTSTNSTDVETRLVCGWVADGIAESVQTQMLTIKDSGKIGVKAKK